MATDQLNGIAYADTDSLVPDVAGLGGLDIADLAALADQNDMEATQTIDPVPAPDQTDGAKPTEGKSGNGAAKDAATDKNKTDGTGEGKGDAAGKADDEPKTAAQPAVTAAVPLPAVHISGGAKPEEGAKAEPREPAKPEYRLVDKDAYRQLLAARKLYANPQGMIARIKARIAATLSGTGNDDALARITAQTRLATLIDKHADLIYENAWHLLYDNAAGDVKAGLDQLLTMAAAELLSDPTTLTKLIDKRAKAVRDKVEAELRPRIETEIRAELKVEADKAAEDKAGAERNTAPSGVARAAAYSTNEMPKSFHGSVPPIDRDSPTFR